MSKANNKKFLPGDLVVVVEGVVEKDFTSSKTATIVEVIEVGLYDLLVMTLTNPYRPSVHKISKSLCQKIMIDDDTLLEAKSVDEPRIGDLVLSYEKSSFGDKPDKKVTGVLYKIKYRLGKKSMCTIMSGTEFSEVRFDSLLLIQRGK
tara:strand:+ start:139 stop:582 length:444 start_codon:yes stop_codon:yes gene_type:complete